MMIILDGFFYDVPTSTYVLVGVIFWIIWRIFHI